MKILTIIGTRPQFIKSATVSQKIKDSDKLIEVIIHTGQHFEREMSNIFFNEMNLSKPNYNLGINQMNHGLMTARMIEKIEPIIVNEDPQCILVYGDTNSTLAGSITAAKLNIPIFHIEAGLRSYNRSMPEEINRLITDHLSSLLFCPTKTAINNLAIEGINKGVVLSGDVMYESFLKFSQQSGRNKVIKEKLDKNYILATIHRQENTDNQDRLTSIFSNLDVINETLKIVMPLHPRTNKKIKDYNIQTKIRILPPQGYLSMLSILINSQLVITDSGGLQKEAFFAKKKCITVRSETEWVELIDSKTNILTKPKEIFKAFDKVNNNNNNEFDNEIFGDGKSSDLIVKSIMDFLNK